MEATSYMHALGSFFPCAVLLCVQFISMLLIFTIFPYIFTCQCLNYLFKVSLVLICVHLLYSKVRNEFTLAKHMRVTLYYRKQLIPTSVHVVLLQAL